MLYDRRARARINIGTDGDQTIISPPGAGAFIDIDHINLIVVGAANTVTLKDGASVIADYPLPVGGTFAFDHTNDNHNSLKLSMNSTFVINISGVNSSVKGFVLYRVRGE